MTRPEWRWEFADAAGLALDRPLSPAFTARFDAEEWLGENWRELAGRGVATAVLSRADQRVGIPVALVGTGIPSEPGPDATGVEH